MAKILTGKIVAKKMNNTVIVEVIRLRPHPLYKKLLKRSKKYKVDMGTSSVAIGQQVKIVETRPLSKDKHFKILDQIKSAK